LLVLALPGLVYTQEVNQKENNGISSINITVSINRIF
jgi:hypothetical protein